MTINYELLKGEARRRDVSVQSLIKRKIGYGKNVNKGMCKNCEFVCIPVWDGEQRMQCTIIGVGNCDAADVNPYWTCKHGYKLRQETIKVIADYIKQLKE